MTEIAFHFNVSDKINHACLLLRKIYNKGLGANVIGSPQALIELDSALWTFSSQEFLAHCSDQAPSQVLKHTPIVLCNGNQWTHGSTVLVNLGPQMPTAFEHFERLIELVGQNQDDRAQARVRWRQYTQMGFAIERFDLLEGK